MNDIALLPASRLAAACDDGFVYLLDGAFEPVGAVEVGERPLLVATMEGPDGTRLLVGTREGVAFVRP